MTRIEICITETSPHTGEQHHSVMVEARGGHLDVFLQAIRAAAVAAGYEPETAAKIVICED